MAKKIDQLAGSFDHENTGGVLTGLLADEENFDRRAMFRLGTWGVASVGAVIIAVLANQSAIKTRRDDVASLDLTRQSMQIQSVAKESQNESRRLASAIDTLNGDRDRLYSRLTSVEQGLDSVTGAIAKQTAAASQPSAVQPSALQPALSLPASSSPASAPQPVAQSAPQEPAPVVAPVATVAAAMSATEKSRVEARKSLAMAAIAPTPLPAPSSQPASTSAMPVMSSRSLMAPPDPAAPKLIEPKLLEPKSPESKSPESKLTEPEPSSKPATAVPTPAPSPAPEIAAKPAPAPVHEAAVAPTADKTKPEAAPLAVKRTEFGVDVGGANSVGGLRALWRGLLKSHANAPLAALQPIIVVKESNNGLGMQLRLVAGPLSDAAAAARICAAIADTERTCETTIYDGQRLAMKTDESPVSTESIPGKPGTEKSGSEKPASERGSEGPSEKPAAKPGSNKYFHRRGAYVSSKRTAAAVVEEPAPAKKPESGGTLSSFFSSRVRPQPQ